MRKFFTTKQIFAIAVSLSVMLGAMALSDAVQAGNGNGNGRGGGGNGPVYFDASTIKTLTGTLTKQYTDWDASGNGNFCGTGQHFEFTAGGTAYSLILGPTYYLEENGVSLSVSDSITVTGSIVDAYISGYADKFIIATVVEGVRIRDDAGYPAWRGGNGANGQGQGKGPQGQNYFDPDTVSSFSGTLSDSLNYWAGFGDGNYTGAGMHYVFTSNNGETFYLMLGPWWFLENSGIELEVGMKISVTGSVVDPYFEGYDEHDFLIAVSITAGGETVELRDAEGYPLWRGGNSLNYYSPNYDPTSAGVLQGEVIGVRTRTHGRNLDAGLELRLRTADRRYNVYLGPQYFCEDLGVSVAKGDQVRIRGSIQKRDMVATTLQVDGKLYRFRARNGNPKWVTGNK